jgi:hypothetical protein
MVTDYITTRIPSVLSEHPELGISIEKVNGREMYRSRVNPNAIGIWISEAKVRAIVDMIPSSATTVNSAVAGAVVEAIQKYNLGDENLRSAQRKHFEAYLTGTSALLPEYAAQEARNLAEKYNLGPEAVARAIPGNVNPPKKIKKTATSEQQLEQRL